MELQTFFDGIRLPEEAVRQVLDLHVPEEEYQEGKILFWENEEHFYEWIKEKEKFRLRFLYYFSRLGCEAYERYAERRISKSIYWDTFRDITYWCQNCYNEYGEYGINQYDWFFRHIKLTIFCLGRLEFELLPSEWEFTYEGRHVKTGEPIIFIHIPQGKKLEIEACSKTISDAGGNAGEWLWSASKRGTIQTREYVVYLTGTNNKETSENLVQAYPYCKQGRRTITIVRQDEKVFGGGTASQDTLTLERFYFG